MSTSCILQKDYIKIFIGIFSKSNVCHPILCCFQMRKVFTFHKGMKGTTRNSGLSRQLPGHSFPTVSQDLKHNVKPRRGTVTVVMVVIAVVLVVVVLVVVVLHLTCHHDNEIG